MPKNDFISDNLVHMRDRLKENAAKAAVPGAVPPAVREPEPEKPRLSTRQPMRSASGGDDDFLRQKRVLIVHGGGFNWKEPDHFRIVYLPRVEELAIAMDKLESFLKKYRQY